MEATNAQVKFATGKEGEVFDRMLHIDEVVELTGLSRSTIYKKMAKGEFPKPLKLGERAVRWRQSEVEAWLASLPRATG